MADQTRKMLPLDSSFLKGLTVPTKHQEFHEKYVKQIKISRDRVFIEICYEIKQRFDRRFIAARYFVVLRSTSKERLGGWLEAMYHVLSE